MATAASQYHSPGAIVGRHTGQYNYVQLAVPVEDVVGQFEFDGLNVPSDKGVYLECQIDPTLGAAGNTYIRIYDMGPSAGPPAAGIEITQNVGAFALASATSGLQYIEVGPLTVAGGPAVGQIQNTSRMYEVTVYQSSLAGDTAHVGFAGLTVK